MKEVVMTDMASDLVALSELLYRAIYNLSLKDSKHELLCFWNEVESGRYSSEFIERFGGGDENVGVATLLANYLAALNKAVRGEEKSELLPLSHEAVSIDPQDEDWEMPF